MDDDGWLDGGMDGGLDGGMDGGLLCQKSHLKSHPVLIRVSPPPAGGAVGLSSAASHRVAARLAL